MTTTDTTFPLKTWKDWEMRKKAERFRFAILMTGGTLIMVPNEHGALEPATNPEDFIRSDSLTPPTYHEANTSVIVKNPTLTQYHPRPLRILTEEPILI